MKANKFETNLLAIFMHKIIRLSSLLTMEPDRGYYGYGYDYQISSNLRKLLFAMQKIYLKKPVPDWPFFFKTSAK